MRVIALAALAACGGSPKYLGAPLPPACSDGDLERCAGWLAERDLIAGELDVYTDAQLQRYVQSIADRLARGANLPHSPRVVIGDHDGTYAAFGERIVIGRMAIERLASEAELAAIVAHELVHIEGAHTAIALVSPETDTAWLATRRDAEAVADERAVALLEHAGYRPTAMHRALAASLEPDDDEHPPREERPASVAAFAGGLRARSLARRAARCVACRADRRRAAEGGPPLRHPRREDRRAGLAVPGLRVGATPRRPGSQACRRRAVQVHGSLNRHGS